MNCQMSGETLSAYLDRELSNAEQSSVAMHLESCARCAREVESLLQAKTALRAHAMPRMPADLRQAIEAATVWRRSWWNRRVAEYRWAPLALGLASAAGGVLLLRWYQKLQVGLPLQIVQKWAPSPRAGESTRLALRHEPPPVSDDCRADSRGC